MTLSFREVDQIIRIIEEFDATEIRFEYGDLKLHVVRKNSGSSIHQHASMAPRESSFVKQRNTATSSPQATPSEPTDLASPRKINERQTSEGPSGCVPVKAPMMGVFYAAPAPDAPPFVRVGDLVKEGADLCIIEVMKVMNNIKSPCEGVIEAIHAENANMVELGEAIFWIKPKP